MYAAACVKNCLCLVFIDNYIAMTNILYCKQLKYNNVLKYTMNKLLSNTLLHCKKTSAETYIVNEK